MIQERSEPNTEVMVKKVESNKIFIMNQFGETELSGYSQSLLLLNHFVKQENYGNLLNRNDCYRGISRLAYFVMEIY